MKIEIVKEFRSRHWTIKADGIPTNVIRFSRPAGRWINQWLYDWYMIASSENQTEVEAAAQQKTTLLNITKRLTS